MLVDLHAHFPMHLIPDEAGHAKRSIRDWGRHRWQARVIDLISRIFNYQGPGDTPSVTAALMREGDVGVILSVLYSPFDEIDLTEPYGAAPRSDYFQDLLDQIEMVEEHVAAHADELVVAHSPAELDALLADRGQRTIMVHAVEGGFHVGADPEQARAHVRTMAQRGVVYLTVAHLFWRQVATNANALPFLPDRLYRFLFRQPAEGLSPIGRAAMETMIDEGVLIDVTHMSQASLDETFALLDERDPGRSVPVIASHMACRLGGLEYALTDETLRRVADRGGLLGCILCEHFMTSGVKGRGPNTAHESVEFLCAHIDHIREVTGSLESVAIGSDLDGYIKPALPGLEHMGHMGILQEALAARYGAADAARICHENALRVLRSGWRRGR